MTGIAAIAAVTVIGLTIAGARAPIVKVPAETSQPVLAGRMLFDKNSCIACHSIHGKGGRICPDLTHVGSKHDAVWLVSYFKGPQVVSPDSIMPKVTLPDKEIQDFTDYMLSLQ